MGKMMEWRETKLGDVIHIKHGYPFESEYFTLTDGRYIVLTPGNFYESGGFLLRPDKDRYYTGSFPKEFVLKKNDLIIAMTEQTYGLLGSPAFIPSDHRFLHNQRLGLVQIKDKSVLHEKYLYYLFFTKRIREEISNGASGTKIRHTAPERIYRCKTLFPPLPVQEKIAAVLSAYDDLIENNNRRIAILEKMAEEIYKEWFVRMRFPGHEKVKFHKGVPEGWEFRRIDQIVERLKFGKIYREVNLSSEGKIAVIDQSESEFLGFYDGEPEHKASIGKPILLFGDHSCKISLMMAPFSLAENVVPFTPKSEVSPFFLYHLTRDVMETQEYKRHWTELSNKMILIPKAHIMTLYSEMVEIFFLQKSRLGKAVRTVKKCRDLLLSRLITGKLSVEDMDIKFPPSMRSPELVERREADG